jgi:hypothetical protein
MRTFGQCPPIHLLWTPPSLTPLLPLTNYDARANQPGDWDYPDNETWCESPATKCTHAGDDSLYVVGDTAAAAVVVVAEDQAACQAACADSNSCRVVEYNMRSRECTLLRSCGTPAQDSEGLTVVVFKPGLVLQGCTDQTAQNYDEDAVYDSGECS